MVLSLCLAAGPVIVESDSEPGTGSAASYDPDPFRNAGSIVTFGMYEQDGDAHNGKESIEWIVLDVQEDRALLLSVHTLDAVTYNGNDRYDENLTWETLNQLRCGCS